MRPATEDIATFIQVVDCGTITAAAARLGLAKSVVSKRVSELEAMLATKLLHRSARRVTPTEAGALFHERGRLLLADIDAMAEAVTARSGHLQGTIRLAAPMSFGARHLARIVARFMAIHARLDVAMDLDDRTVDLLGGGYDLGVRIGRLGDSALRSRRLGASRRIVCCSPAYAGRAGVPDSLDALGGHSCLGYSNASSSHIWRFRPLADPGGAARSVLLRGRLATNSGEALLAAAIEGLGLIVLPSFLVGDALRAGTLRAVRICGWEPVPDSIHVVYPETSALPLKIRALIDFLADALREPFAWDEAL